MIKTDIPYNSIALVYDEFGLDEFSLRMIPYIKSILGLKTFKRMKILDLACGSGSSALELADQGAQVVGVDSSEVMLSFARKKMKTSRRKVQLIHDDLRTIEIDDRFDLILCLFDTVNHFIHIGDVQNIFAKVSRLLKPSGRFVFDLNTHYGFKKNWHNLTVVRESERIHSIWYTSYDAVERIAEITITVFLKSANQTHKIAEVTVPERAYRTSEIKQILRGAGLHLERIFECFTEKPPGGTTPRSVYVCRGN
ncbi:MAG TPA: class I SAM-dependent methyltransferase [candidate division Zixibacteria bacterium]|nr:class I SAM-dependent methyltransferase [candidate division Zixibacteria bacterium]